MSLIVTFHPRRQYRELGFTEMRNSTSEADPIEAARIRSIVGYELERSEVN